MTGRRPPSRRYALQIGASCVLAWLAFRSPEPAPESSRVVLADVLRGATEYLAGRGVASPRVDAELLLARALGLTRIELYTHHDRPLTEGERSAVRELVRRRGRREPLAYVLGEWGFRRLVLVTDRRALVPRPETEIVVERCLALLAEVRAPRVLDVGVGSGAIALALAQEVPGARVTATDASAAALALARENADRLGATVELVEGDLFAGVPGPFDLVVSNPPYVDEAELDSLEPEVRDWEPRGAVVDAGQTERIAEAARDVLAGWLVLETHAARADAAAKMLKGLGYADVGVTPDLAGRPRVVEGRYSG
ncbi:MAG TPA: peptide chain release factor N(5)-glutamine methyltransferase [Gaiellaceae bacterium]|nr:peptide chain release factor N(5)-glutamine methyltransferase [Gaiellaceae bacterium]